VEIKNIQGLKNLEKALKFEASRQAKMLEAGMRIVRETRRYDEERKVTMSAREKEFEEDYGYIGEPDLGTYKIGNFARSVVTAETPLRRAQRIAGECVLDFEKAKQVVLTSMALADILEALAKRVDPEFAMNWVLGPISANWSAIQPRLDQQVQADIVRVVGQVADREITDSEGRRRIGAIAAGECPEDISCAVADSELEAIISTFLDANPNVVKDYATNPKAANSAIGHVLKTAPGKYNSKEVVEAVKKEIEKRS